MRQYFNLVLLIICFIWGFDKVYAQSNSRNFRFKDCDIVFQASKSSQSPFLALLTNSIYTHCGIVTIKGNTPYVIEAVKKVREVPLEQWVKNGRNGSFAVARYKGAISKSERKSIMDFAKKQIGKDYDYLFQWSNSKMYCSELVWKAYEKGNIKISGTKKFTDYPIWLPIAQKEINRRYKKDEFNKNEIVVSPADIFESSRVDIVLR